MSCKNCGKEISSIAVLCTSCGVPTDKCKRATGQSLLAVSGKSTDSRCTALGELSGRIKQPLDFLFSGHLGFTIDGG